MFSIYLTNKVSLGNRNPAVPLQRDEREEKVGHTKVKHWQTKISVRGKEEDGSLSAWRFAVREKLSELRRAWSPELVEGPPERERRPCRTAGVRQRPILAHREPEYSQHWDGWHRFTS